jgi:uncharacterized protein (TIGR00369 family)
MMRLRGDEVERVEPTGTAAGADYVGLPERLRRMEAAQAPLPGIVRTLGLRWLEHGDGAARFAMTVSEAYHNPMGTLHGGILCDIGDAAMGIAYASQLAEDETFTTLEMKVNFLRPVWNGEIIAKARVVSRGRTVGLVECDVEDEHGRLVAHLTSTCMTLRGEAARGR